jgi:predicted HNH restriction endonuclease
MPSQLDYFQALGAISLTDLQKSILRIHYAAPLRTITSAQLSRALGYSKPSTANANYGKLGRKIGVEMSFEGQNENPLGYLVDFDQRDREWHWIMKPELASALEQKGLVSPAASEVRSRNSWIFQGNPKRYDLDDYLARYPFVYWSTPQNSSHIGLGDRAFIWRSGKDAGLVAVGTVEEMPVARDAVAFPENLGEDLWVAEGENPSSINTGIRISEVRTSAYEGMLTRSLIAADPIMRFSTIIRQPHGTVFSLTSEQASTLLGLWNGELLSRPFLKSQVTFALEGSVMLRSHYRRERNSGLIEAKKRQFLSAHGSLHCEVCGFDYTTKYPDILGQGFIEVHHVIPLSQSAGPRRTNLDDLLLVCSDCHRMIHRTYEAEKNLAMLREHFSRRH